MTESTAKCLKYNVGLNLWQLTHRCQFEDGVNFFKSSYVLCNHRHRPTFLTVEIGYSRGVSVCSRKFSIQQFMREEDTCKFETVEITLSDEELLFIMGYDGRSHNRFLGDLEVEQLPGAVTVKRHTEPPQSRVIYLPPTELELLKCKVGLVIDDLHIMNSIQDGKITRETDKEVLKRLFSALTVCYDFEHVQDALSSIGSTVMIQFLTKAGFDVADDIDFDGLVDYMQDEILFVKFKTSGVPVSPVTQWFAHRTVCGNPNCFEK